MASRKRHSKAEIKAAADRAEKRAAGEDIEAPKSPVLEPEEMAPKTGRPTDYDPSFCQIAADACARGATIAEVADLLGVDRRTVYRWSSRHEAFCHALNVGRELADRRVGYSLYERAVGYTYDAVKIMQYEGSPVIIPYQEHVPPDVGAQKMWLTNRDPENWRERSNVEHTGKDGGPIEVADINKVALARWIAKALNVVTEQNTIDVTPG